MSDDKSDVEIIPDEEIHAEGDVQADVPARVISSVLGLMGFFTALLVGLVVGNPGITIVVRALLAMAICTIAGRIIGKAGEICVREFLRNYKTDRPTPELPVQLKRLYEVRAQDEALREQMKRTAS